LKSPGPLTTPGPTLPVPECAPPGPCVCGLPADDRLRLRRRDELEREEPRDDELERGLPAADRVSDVADRACASGDERSERLDRRDERCERARDDVADRLLVAAMIPASAFSPSVRSLTATFETG
jgi:hypothetical protein